MQFNFTKTYFKHSKGFTLIELLVVIAIIGVLSSVVFTSLNSARAKAKDAAVKAGLAQLSTLMNFNYDEYGSYCQLQSAWFSLQVLCDAAFSGIYAVRARQMCNNIFNNA